MWRSHSDKQRCVRMDVETASTAVLALGPQEAAPSLAGSVAQPLESACFSKASHQRDGIVYTGAVSKTCSVGCLSIPH